VPGLYLQEKAPQTLRGFFLGHLEF